MQFADKTQLLKVHLEKVKRDCKPKNTLHSSYVVYRYAPAPKNLCRKGKRDCKPKNILHSSCVVC